MSEFKKLFEIKGFDDGRKLIVKDREGYCYHNGAVWRRAIGGQIVTVTDFVNSNWDKPVWKIYEKPKPQPEYEDKFYELECWNFSKMPVFDKVSCVSINSQGFLHYIIDAGLGDLPRKQLIGVKPGQLKGVVMRKYN